MWRPARGIYASAGAAELLCLRNVGQNMKEKLNLLDSVCINKQWPLCFCLGWQQQSKENARQQMSFHLDAPAVAVLLGGKNNKPTDVKVLGGRKVMPVWHASSAKMGTRQN